MAGTLSKNIRNPDKNVQFVNGWNHSFREAVALPFENRTLWNPIFKRSGFVMFLDSEWLDFKSPFYLKKYNCVPRMSEQELKFED